MSARGLVARLRLGADDRRITLLAIPALGGLAAEPLYVLVDTAIVGHLGVAPLAALALGGTVLSTVTGLCNFLAYGSTPKVGQLFATGDRTGAAHLGRQAMFFAGVLGILVAMFIAGAAVPLLSLFGGSGHVRALASVYLRISAIGLPCALTGIASQGYFRGVARLVVPLIILLAGNLLNAVLELWFVDGLKWGIAGSAWGTVIAQITMAGVFLFVVWERKQQRAASSASRRFFDIKALLSLARISGEIFLRTVALYGVFLVAGAILARVGAGSLAAHQVVFQLWNFTAYLLDALAIAAQVLVSHHLAVGQNDRARSLATRVLVWALVFGTFFGVLLLGLGSVLPHAFTDSPRVLDRVHAVWPLFALMMPVYGLAFAFDGILIGAADTRFTAFGMFGCTLVAFLPLAVISAAAGWGIVGVWVAISAFACGRVLVNGRRFLGDRWTRHLSPRANQQTVA